MSIGKITGSAIWLGIAMACSNPVWGQGTAETPTLDEIWALQEALEADKKHADAQQQLQAFGADTARPAIDRARIYGYAAYGCTQTKDPVCYRENIDLAIETEPSVGRLMDILLSGGPEDNGHAADSLTWLIEQKSPALEDVSIHNFWSAIKNLPAETSDDRTYRLLSALHASDYTGDSTGLTPDFLYLELVRLAFKRGDMDKGRQVADQAVTSLRSLLTVWLNRQYEPLWAKIDADGRFAPDSLLTEELHRTADARGRAQDGDWEGWMRATVNYIQTLRAANMLPEATRICEYILDIAPESERQNEYYFWIVNELAYIYEDLGRTDEALALLENLAALDVSENQALVSQIINYAAMLWRHRRFEQALNVADRVLDDYQDYTSDYGRYWANSVKACTLEAQSNTDAAAAILDDMLQKPETNYSATTVTALCLNRADDVAAIFVKRLADEHERNSALIALSRFTGSRPVGEEAALRKLLDQITEREDVQQAVQAVGRLGSWNISASYWGEF